MQSIAFLTGVHHLQMNVLILVHKVLMFKCIYVPAMRFALPAHIGPQAIKKTNFIYITINQTNMKETANY